VTSSNARLIFKSNAQYFSIKRHRYQDIFMSADLGLYFVKTLKLRHYRIAFSVIPNRSLSITSENGQILLRPSSTVRAGSGGCNVKRRILLADE